MLKVAMTLANGEHVRTTVIQIQFIVTCPYCKLRGEADPDFLTIDVDQKFCCSNHRKFYSRKVTAPSSR